MSNNTLHAAKRAKNDEFYTRRQDVENEIEAYLEADPDLFRGKTILLPCDDPEWSEFTRYFSRSFSRLGIKKIISTSYAPASKGMAARPTAAETSSAAYDAAKSESRGRILTLSRDANGDGRIDLNDFQWEYLEGDGDFRSPEVTALRDEADFIITNPPFSLFREFLSWVVEGGKQFSMIGSVNAITYREVFPLIRDGKMWMGGGFARGNAFFAIPEGARTAYAPNVYDPKTGTVKLRNAAWFTNIDHNKRHDPLSMATTDALRQLKGIEFQRYDNYDAIEVPRVEYIPADYAGVMGVPISFLDKFNPDQFEIIGITERSEDSPAAAHRIEGHKKYDRPYLDGNRIYARILIKRRDPQGAARSNDDR